ncbi:MAG: hypothetical protein V1722_02995 [Candidatus Micrarchaeota archaeon]
MNAKTIAIAIIIVAALGAILFLIDSGSEIKKATLDTHDFGTPAVIPLLAIQEVRCQTNCNRTELIGCNETIVATRKCTSQFAPNEEIKDTCVSFVDSYSEYEEITRNSNELLLGFDKQIITLNVSMPSLTGVKEKTTEMLDKLGLCTKAIAKLRNYK